MGEKSRKLTVFFQVLVKQETKKKPMVNCLSFGGKNLIFSKGSEWRKWDLHVHTPASLVASGYGKDSDETWERYITDLEALPPAFSVLGINDYIFIDGYKRLVEAKNSGRLKNIDLLLPVIELRLDKFGGTNTKLSRVNFHIIFSNEIKAEVIEQQFLSALKPYYKLSAQYEFSEIKWNGVPTKESLTELGEMIIAGVPEKERNKFGTALTEGFNNLNISIESIKNALKNHSFDKKFLTGVGKTEWWDIQWNDKSIADKKNIIQSADFVFIASKDAASFYKARKSLEDSSVNRYLLDCSDAHNYSTSKNKDRLGQSFTWINADPTFRGLFHALIEYDERVFVGDVPPLLERVNENQTKYFSKISVKKKKKATIKGEAWFNSELEFNPGLVSVIGNKGMGKSALADILGLLCNSRHQDSFSFLHPDKFKKKPENLASFFEAELVWMSGKRAIESLDADVNLTKVEQCTYIPQSYFEEITNQLGNIDESIFEKEIKKVIFSHVPEAEKLGKAELSELLDYKTSVPTQRVETIRKQLAKQNTEITELEQKQSSANKSILRNKILEKKSEISSHKKSRPKALPKPKGKSASLEIELTKAITKRDALAKQIAEAKTRLAKTIEDLAAAENLSQKIDAFKADYDDFLNQLKVEFENLAINLEPVIKLSLDKKPVQEFLADLKKKKNKTSAELAEDDPSSKLFKYNQWVSKIKELNEALDRPMKNYQRFKERQEKWETDHALLIGTLKKPGTLKYYEDQFERLDLIPDKLKVYYRDRAQLAKKLYRELEKIKQTYIDLYKPVQEFIEVHPEISSKISIEFDVSLLNIGFAEGFLSFVNRGRKGAFSGNAGLELIDSLVQSHDFNNEDSTLAFIDSIISNLLGNAKPVSRMAKIENQLKSGQTVNGLLDYLFSLEYLQPRYVLKMGGKNLAQLSPGERGALLLVFYLLVDRNDIPLIIDQPEHNLDNQTIVDLLVPAVKKAKKKRQIIIITHNPNLAVVCDADQIIWATLDKQNEHSITYEAGSLENPSANQKVIDILEGNWRSFSNRGRKYSEPKTESVTLDEKII